MAFRDPNGLEHKPAKPLSVEFSLGSDGFPPHLAELRIQHVLLAVVRTPGAGPFELGSTQLTLTPAGTTTPVGGAVPGTVDGLISTRRGTASAWVPLIGRSPAGTWRLILPATAEMRERFAREEIEDLLLVVTYEGRTPPWPV